MIDDFLSGDGDTTPECEQLTVGWIFVGSLFLALVCFWALLLFGSQGKA